MIDDIQSQTDKTILLIQRRHLNPFHITGLFVHPVKTSKNQRLLGWVERD